MRPSELDAGLEKLAGLGRALAEHRTEIGIARLPPRRAAGKVVERDGDGEVRPQRHLDAVPVGREEQAAAEVLAEQLDEDTGLVHDRRIDEGVTCVGEEGAKGLIQLGHWKAGRWLAKVAESTSQARARNS